MNTSLRTYSNQRFVTTFLICVLAFFASIQGWGQTTIVNYDFNSSSAYPVSPTSVATNVTSTGTSSEAYAIFGGTATGAAAFTANTTAGNAIAMNNSSGTNTRYFQFQQGGTALVNYSSYKVYLQAQRSGTGAPTLTLAYSTDGTTYTNFGTTGTTGNGSFSEITYDLSTITAINNVSSLYFRIYASGASSTGTLRLDNFEIQANAPAVNYYWNGSNTTALNATWNNTATNWSTPTATTTVNAAWPSAGNAIANFNGTGGGTVTLPGTIAVAPTNTNIGSSAYTFVTGSTNAALSSPINLNSNTLSFIPGTGNIALSGNIAGTGGLVLNANSTGNLNLSGTNTFTGGININSTLNGGSRVRFDATTSAPTSGTIT